MAGPNYFTCGPTLKTGVEKGVALFPRGLIMTACPVRSTTAMFTFDGLDQSNVYISHQQARGRSADTLSPASCVLSLDAAHARHGMAKHVGKAQATKTCTHVDATWARLIKAMAREGMSWSQTHTINCRGNGAIAKALKKPVISAGGGEASWAPYCDQPASVQALGAGPRPVAEGGRQAEGGHCCNDQGARGHSGLRQDGA